MEQGGIGREIRKHWYCLPRPFLLSGTSVVKVPTCNEYKMCNGICDFIFRNLLDPSLHLAHYMWPAMN